MVAIPPWRIAPWRILTKDKPVYGADTNDAQPYREYYGLFEQYRDIFLPKTNEEKVLEAMRKI